MVVVVRGGTVTSVSVTVPTIGLPRFYVFTTLPSFGMFITYVFFTSFFHLPLPFHSLFLSNMKVSRTLVTVLLDIYSFVSVPTGFTLSGFPYFYTLSIQPSFGILITYVSLVTFLKDPLPFHRLFLSNMNDSAVLTTYPPPPEPTCVNTTGHGGAPAALPVTLAVRFIVTS